MQKFRMVALSVILGLCMASSVMARCVANDAWTGRDKALHLAAGAAAGSAGTLVFKDPHKGFLLGVGIGLAKEVWDSQHADRHTCSLQDFAVTAAGAAAGAYGTAWLVLPQRQGVVVAYVRAL